MTIKIAEIPKEVQVTPHVCDRYLVDGELKTWKGNTTEVFFNHTITQRFR